MCVFLCYLCQLTYHVQECGNHHGAGTLPNRDAQPGSNHKPFSDSGELKQGVLLQYGDAAGQGADYEHNKNIAKWHDGYFLTGAESVR